MLVSLPWTMARLHHFAGKSAVSGSLDLFLKVSKVPEGASPVWCPEEGTGLAASVMWLSGADLLGCVTLHGSFVFSVHYPPVQSAPGLDTFNSSSLETLNLWMGDGVALTQLGGEPGVQS